MKGLYFVTSVVFACAILLLPALVHAQTPTAYPSVAVPILSSNMPDASYTPLPLVPGQTTKTSSPNPVGAGTMDQGDTTPNGGAANVVNNVSTFDWRWLLLAAGVVTVLAIILSSRNRDRTISDSSYYRANNRYAGVKGGRVRRIRDELEDDTDL